ncbi:MAG: cbb3-type cytochrome oxidase subunit 3 [Burkholderiaceae bacterium]
MDINIIRIAVTILSFVAFAGIMVWVMRPANRDRFAAAEKLPFVDTDGARHE